MMIGAYSYQQQGLNDLDLKLHNSSYLNAFDPCSIGNSKKMDDDEVNQVRSSLKLN